MSRYLESMGNGEAVKVEWRSITFQYFSNPSGGLHIFQFFYIVFLSLYHTSQFFNMEFFHLGIRFSFPIDFFYHHHSLWKETNGDFSGSCFSSSLISLYLLSTLFEIWMLTLGTSDDSDHHLFTCIMFFCFCDQYFLMIACEEIP